MIGFIRARSLAQSRPSLKQTLLFGALVAGIAKTTLATLECSGFHSPTNQRSLRGCTEIFAYCANSLVKAIVDASTLEVAELELATASSL